MRRNIVIIGIIISAIAFCMFIFGVSAHGAAKYNQNIDPTHASDYNTQIFIYNLLADLGFILMFIGIPTAIIGLVLKSKEQKQISSDRHCPNCGRVIPIDARICPYCKKDFEKN
jgi:hypothetical protein